jgi:hypothetical protein
MNLTEWRRRRIIREEYQRLLEEGFRAEVRRQLQDQVMGRGDAAGCVTTWTPLQLAGLSLAPVAIVISEAVLLLK